MLQEEEAVSIWFHLFARMAKNRPCRSNKNFRGDTGIKLQHKLHDILFRKYFYSGFFNTENPQKMDNIVSQFFSDLTP